MKLFKKKYKFREPENTACFTCEHVVNKSHPILYVSHDSDDGSWQFLCGTESHDGSNARIVGLKQVTEIDPTLNKLYDLPLGSEVERTEVGGEWLQPKQSR
jgi:hypothetical protein